jgi:hypothetical protein
MDMNPGDLPLLVSLNALIEECNVTRAAGRLHLSQPAMSAQLARLRTLFDDALLVPSESGRGMVPTPRALPWPNHCARRCASSGMLSEHLLISTRCAQSALSIAANDNAVIMLGLEMVKRMDQSGGPVCGSRFTNPRSITLSARWSAAKSTSCWLQRGRYPVR